MRRHEIESWALNVTERAQLKQPIEDSRVELKGRWPDDFKKAARRIAAHANAARGEPILWIIGVDEETGDVLGAAPSEFASWYNSIRSQFDELAPEPISLNIPVGGVTVTALFFETDAAPFVVKNSEGGSIQREVPWREATGVRSATRAQLLRLLSPLQQLPQIEVVASRVKIGSWKAENGTHHLSCDLKLALFLTQPTQQESVFPSHRSEVVYHIPTLEPLRAAMLQFYNCGAKNTDATDSFISIRSSGLFEVRKDTSFTMPGAAKRVADNTIFAQGLTVGIILYSATAERHIRLALELKEQTSGDAKSREWRNGWHIFEERFR